MRNKKTYIILIVIILIFFAVMFLVFGIDNIRQEKYTTTIIIDNDIVWSLRKKKWSNYHSYSKLNWKEFNVYVDNKKFGNYYLWHNDKWYLFDSKKNAINYDGRLIAYRSNYKMNIYDYNIENIEDFTYVNEVLMDNNISNVDEYTAKNKVSLDYDNDGEIEDFYLVSNVFSMESNPDKVFSIVFMVKDNEVYSIYTDIEKNTSFNGCKPYFNTFIDVDNDNKYELVLSCAKYSVSHTSNMLYKFKDNKFKILISN